MLYKIKQLADEFNLEFEGNENYEVDSVASISKANAKSVIFLNEKKYISLLNNTKSKVLITKKNLIDSFDGVIIYSENPYLIFSKLSQLFNLSGSELKDMYISDKSINSHIDKSVKIGKNVYIGANVQIGKDSIISSNSVISDNVQIGKSCFIYPNVTIYHETIIGFNCIIHAGVVIGSDGFGYVKEGNEWFKIPQIGAVHIGNNVEIGANTTIDRGTLDNTIICDGVKLDNQVQVAHNVYIGENTAVAGCVGIAGSAVIGKNCAIGGGAGIQGHIQICDNTHVTGMSKISSSITKPGVYSSGTPFMENKIWLKNAALFKKLEKLLKK